MNVNVVWDCAAKACSRNTNLCNDAADEYGHLNCVGIFVQDCIVPEILIESLVLLDIHVPVMGGCPNRISTLCCFDRAPVVDYSGLEHCT